MLRRLGFNDKWISKVICLESSNVSILVHGSPTNEFKLSKGLGQQNPLVPFLFNVVANGLWTNERSNKKGSFH